MASATSQLHLMPERAARGAIVLGAVALLAGCMVLPRTTQVFDRDCQMMARHVVLDEVQVASIGGCANQGCVALIVITGAVSAATAVVSGTIYVVGNVAYWLERQVRCEPPLNDPGIDALAPAATRATLPSAVPAPVPAPAPAPASPPASEPAPSPIP